MIPLFRRRDIRSRLAIALWGTAFIAFLIAGAGVAIYQSHTIEQRARQIMEPYAQFVAVGADAAIAFEDPGRAQEILDTLRAIPQIRSAEIYLGNGRLLAHIGSASEGSPADPTERHEGVHVADDTAEFQLDLPRNARLRIRMGLEQLTAQTHQTLWLLGAASLVLLAVTLIQLAVLRRTIVRPIASLMEATEYVRTHGDYELRMPPSDTHELSRLGESFNAMMSAIHEREIEMRRLTDFQRTILDNVAYGIISTTPEGVVTSFNAAASRLLGYPPEEVVGKMTPERWHDADEVARYAQTLSVEFGETIAPGFDVFRAKSRRNLKEEQEWTFIRKDGARVPVLLSVSALRDQGGRITGYVGLTYDLTERKRAEEDIRRLNSELELRVAERTEQLEATNRELEAFSYSVSHDLRAPLRHIDGFLGLLKERIAPALDEESRRYMDTVSGAAMRMSNLIDDLLAFSRSGRFEMIRSRLDLGALVEEVIAELRSQSPERKVSWRIGELPTVMGDRAMLRVVLVNLISNALKYTRPRDAAEIEIGCRRSEPGEVTVFVRDNGVGFDMRYVDKLFGVFQRLHSIDDFEGTGIGLANVRRVIDRHGGKTWAEGKVDGGATFYFSLPTDD